jgi:hypothetical protein
MNPSSFWRKVVALLVLVNVLFALWTGGYLAFLGLDPSPLREPARLDDQVSPEAVRLKMPGVAAPQAAPASAAASD